MSSYSHDLKKAADTGLQLRLPVDLVPATQYSRFTNALPRIEGELRTRDGLVFIADIPQIAFINSFAPAGLVLIEVVNATTNYPHGFIVGDLVTITIYAVSPGQTGPPTISLGSYPVTITSFTTTAPYTDFTFTPPIPAALIAGIYVFAQAVSSDPINVLTATPITNLFRLNQAIQALAGDRIAVMNGRIYHAPLPAGDTFLELISPRAPGSTVPIGINGLSGRPLSIIEFRFTRDTASWAIFADQQGMLKYRPGQTDDQLEFCPLGNAPPTVAATASAGGAGNLNSTGGTGYDWRYTYVDGYAFTESNPSPINMSSGGTSTTRPTTFTNPATAGNAAFTSPGNAIDGSTTTFATGSSLSEATSGGTVSHRTSCQWLTWLAPAGTVTAITLNVKARLSGSITTESGAHASADLYLQYSYDAGVTFQSLASSHVTILNGHIDTGIQTYSAVIPSAISLTNLILRAIVSTTARGNPITREFASATADMLIYDINTSVTQTGSVNALVLVNKIGVLCVTPSPYPQHKFINLYRRGGSLTDAWRLVGQFQQSTLVIGACGAGTVEIDDNVSDTTLSTAALLELDNDQPVTSVNQLNQPLSSIWGPTGIDARVLGCGDPARPECVYFSKPGNADAWPPENFIEVSSPGTPVIAGCVFNTRTFAFDRESIYELVEGLGTGTTYTPFRTPSVHGLYTPQALALGPAMYFVSKDGIYATEGGQEVSLVENDIKPLFPTYDQAGESVNGYEAVDYTQADAMRLRYHNSELYFSYVGRDTDTRQLLIYDILKKRWRAGLYTNGISELYSEPATVSSLLMGTTSGNVYIAGGPFDPDDLDTIEQTSGTAVTAASTLAAGTWYTRVARYTTDGAVALAYETSVVLTPGQGIQITIPNAPAGTLKWRAFFGTTQGLENQYQEFLESGLPADRTVVITQAGTAGTVPLVNASNEISVLVRTGAHDQGAPLNRKQYGNVIFDLDPGGATVASPVTITPLINGEAQTNAAIVVSGSGRQQVPLDLSDYFAFNTEYEIAWSRTDLGGGQVSDPVVFQYDTLTFTEPVGVTHWKAQPTSFAFPGFMHCRDAYIAIRSTASVTLTMKFDTGTGALTTQTYTLPSTSGQRLKQYVQFASNKGLLYEFALDSEQEFRIYESDIETRVKPFLGLLGYSVQRVLGGEVNA